MSKESLFEDAGTIISCPDILHTGRDGKERLLCGPGIHAAKMGARQAGNLDNNFFEGYLDNKLMCRRACTNLVHAHTQGDIRESQKPCEPCPYIKPIYQFGLINKRKSDPFQEVYAHHGNKLEIMEEPIRGKVQPNFPTPTDGLKKGRWSCTLGPNSMENSHIFFESLYLTYACVLLEIGSISSR